MIAPHSSHTSHRPASEVSALNPIAHATETIMQGNLWLALCCGVYLAWWCVAFNPLRDFPMGLKVVGFILTLALGIYAVVLLGSGVGALPPGHAALPGWALWLIGAGVYGVLLFLSSKLFKRQVTTELLLICAWATFELSIVSALAGVDSLRGVGLGIAIAAVLGAALAAMGCYLAYYELAPLPAFICGMLPLVFCGAAGLIVNACIALP